MNASQDLVLDEHVLDVLRWTWSEDVCRSLALETRSRELLLDTLGCAIAGFAAPEVAALFAGIGAVDPGSVAFPGLEIRPSVFGFTSAMGAAACWHEACEGLAAAHGRPGLHAVCAVLGPALAQRASLGSVLNAVVAGYEVGGRLGAVLRIRPGMHVDGTWGSFAAAAAACRLAGDEPESALDALNHAACHMPFSLYRPIAFGSTARNAYPGHGAMHGLASALASRAGLPGPAGSIAAMARIALGLDVGRLTEMQPPGRWLLLDGYLKPYPAVRHVHYAAASAEAWHAEVGAPAETVTGVTLRTYQEALDYCGNRAPETAIQAQFSLTYGTASSLVHGRLDPAAYGTGRLADPAVRRLEAMVRLDVDTALTQANRRGCTLEVVAGGRAWTHTVETAPGDRSMDLMGQSVRDKFMAYATPVLGQEKAAGIATFVLEFGLDEPLVLLP